MVRKSTTSFDASTFFSHVTIPTNDMGLVRISRLVLIKWLSTPTIFLLWTSVYEFRVYVNSFSSLCKSLQNTIRQRALLVKKIQILERTMNKAIPALERNIRKTLDTTENLDLSLFGFIVDGSKISLPVEYELRINALKLLERRLKLFSIKLNKQDMLFWKSVRPQFQECLNELVALDSVIEQKESSKAFYKEQIQITLQSLIYCLKSNFPKTYKYEFQNWGF